MEFKGKHLMLALQTDFDLEDTPKLREILEEAVVHSGATICGEKEHKFQPQGYSLVILISESHASVHTFPEDNSLFIDYFTCGSVNPDSFRTAILHALRPTKILEDAIIERPLSVSLDVKHDKSGQGGHHG